MSTRHLCMKKYFDEAIELAKRGVKNLEGGPFGAVVVKDGKIIGYGNNKVLKEKDPTAHAEIIAIRDACKRLNTHDLTGCVIYTTSEPCPMCLSAIIWSNIKVIYFSTDRKEVAEIGFRDDMIYNYLENKEKDILEIHHIENNKCQELLESYNNELY